MIQLTYASVTNEEYEESIIDESTDYFNTVCLIYYSPKLNMFFKYVCEKSLYYVLFFETLIYGYRTWYKDRYSKEKQYKKCYNYPYKVLGQDMNLCL